MGKVSFGFALRNSGMTDDFERLKRIAIEGETLGYDSLWVSERVLPTKRWKEYFCDSIFEPVSTLGILSQVTRKIILGTSVLLPIRHPVLTYRMIGTIDHASRGRLILGLGAGWYRPEFRVCGVPYEDRGIILEEQLKILTALWSKRNAKIRSKYYPIGKAITSPEPYQKPHPPIWLGGNSITAVDRVARFGDGWIPSCPTVAEYAEGLQRIRETLSRVGAKDKKITAAHDVYSFITTKDVMSRKTKEYLSLALGGSQTALSTRCAIGDATDVIRFLTKFVDVGVRHVVFRFVPGEEVQSMRRIASEVLPSF